MQPFNEEEVRRILDKNPEATRQMIEEYQALQAKKFALGPRSRLADPEQLDRANEVRRKIEGLHKQIFGDS